MLITIAWVLGIILAAYLVIRTVVYFRREAGDVSPLPCGIAGTPQADIALHTNFRRTFVDCDGARGDDSPFLPRLVCWDWFARIRTPCRPPC
jgi:hypothetical protein